MHECAGVKAQKDNVMVHGWKCENDQTAEVPMKITTNEEKVRMINV